jgi:DNA repair protein RadC
MTRYSDYQQKAIKTALSAIQQTLITSNAMQSSREVEQYLKIQLGAESDEHFAVLFLTSQHHLISFQKLFRGTIDASHVHVRVIAKKALELNAAAVILAHNHPSGIAEPSSSDRMITDIIQTALEMFDIKVLDHFVVSPIETCSFANRGWM